MDAPNQTTMPVADLVKAKAPYNPRRIEAAEYARLRDSVERWGLVDPVVYNERTGTIVGGHQRIDAAESLGIKTAPVAVVDLSENEERALNLALNKISGSWDWDALRGVMDTMDPELLAASGFSPDELKALDKDGDLLEHDLAAIRAQLKDKRQAEVVKGNTDPDAVPADVDTFVEPGDLWVLGEHRLICGDCTEAHTVERLLDGASPRLMVTDPPYGVDYDAAWRQEASERGDIHGGARRLGTVSNDDRADWREAWALFPGDVAYTWCAPGDLSIRAGLALIESGFSIRNQIIWKKAHFPISRGHYTYQHEACWYAVRKGKGAHWTGDKSASTVWEMSLDDNVRGGHSTQKPVEAMRTPIHNHDSPEVYEPFLGSGTTIIAAEQLGRRCYAIEIDPHYCSVAIRRWEEFTGKKAERTQQAPVHEEANA